MQPKKIIKKNLPEPGFWQGKKVLITGHTGFKGGWLTLWLRLLNAKVYGLSLEPESLPNLFSSINIVKSLESDYRADIRDEQQVTEIITIVKPDIIFHMAAQPLVRESYKNAPYTFSTNAIGTLNVLEAIRRVGSVKVAVMVTTDKVYENHEWPYPYREIDSLGGKDPYSASKACAEIIINSYRRSFFSDGNTSISTVRAGNVIGGGDWSADRLVPDAVRAFSSKSPLLIRNPDAIRPWQHVLDALSGYLILAETQWSHPNKFAEAWNFAPDIRGECTVGYLADYLSEIWDDTASVLFSPSPDDPPEASYLRLDSSKARLYLGWNPMWTLQETLNKTVTWYKTWQCGEDMKKFSEDQIQDYISSEFQ